MDLRRLMAAVAALSVLVVILLAVSLPAAGGGVQKTLSLNIAAFELRDETTHFDDDCTPGGSSDDVESQGTVNGAGGYIGIVDLPQGQIMTGFSLSVRDNDGANDAHAYLLRKRLAPEPGVDGSLGYKVVSQVESSGASTDLRRFFQGLIFNRVINNPRYSYFVEVVNCADTVQPVGVQIDYRKP